ncbi:MAG: ABZJ_00895 family protein [Tabrizicola sp.]
MNSSMPLGRMLAVFLAVLVGGNAILAAVTYAFPDLPVPNSIGMIFMMVSAMSAGQSVAGRLGRLLTAREKLVFAICATVLCVLLAVVVFWAILAYVGLPMSLQNVIAVATGEMVPLDEIKSFLPWILLFGIVLNLLVAYFFVGFGVKNQLKALERKAAKGS